MGSPQKSAKEPRIPDDARRILVRLAADWTDVSDPAALQVVPLKGAMTNEVYQIKWIRNSSAEEPLPRSKKVLVRIYGAGVEVFFDRENEIRTFEFMSKQGQGPRLLGRFANGRVEEFIHARTLSAADLRDPEISGIIASKLKEFHNLDMPGSKKIDLWDRVRKWLNEARRLSSPKEAEEFRLHDLEAEISALEKNLCSNGRHIGFCHNDLQYGNIMIDEVTRSITIISDAYSWVHTVTEREDVSCCTVIAENFATTTPEILAGQGFSRLLLAGILMDTGNLSSPHCTPKDNYMATLLINGAGRFGFNGLYQILKYTTQGSTYDLKVEDILQKEFKKWTISGKPNSVSSGLEHNIGMSSIGLSVAQLLSHDSASVQEIIHFQKLEKLGILLVVSGYYDSQKRFKREILVSAESSQLMKNMLMFLNSSASQLPLRALNQPGLQGEMRVFEIDKVTSRRTIERLLNDFAST